MNHSEGIMEGHEVLQKEGYSFNHTRLEPCMQGNQSRQIIPKKANRPVHDSEVAGQEGSTEPGGQSRPTMVMAVQQKVEWGRHDGALSHTHEMVSDISGKWGCGAFYRKKWFQLQ